MGDEEEGGLLAEVDNVAFVVVCITYKTTSLGLLPLLFLLLLIYAVKVRESPLF